MAIDASIRARTIIFSRPYFRIGTLIGNAAGHQQVKSKNVHLPLLQNRQRFKTMHSSAKKLKQNIFLKFPIGTSILWDK